MERRRGAGELGSGGARETESREPKGGDGQGSVGAEKHGDTSAPGLPASLAFQQGLIFHLSVNSQFEIARPPPLAFYVSRITR